MGVVHFMKDGTATVQILSILLILVLKQKLKSLYFNLLEEVFVLNQLKTIAKDYYH